MTACEQEMMSGVGRTRATPRLSPFRARSARHLAIVLVGVMHECVR